LFLAFVIIGASVSLTAVTDFSDAMILAMVFPNMIGLFFLFPRVREELGRYLGAIKKSKK
jgi:alanine or glycine:cation symporter, AGCS family